MTDGLGVVWTKDATLGSDFFFFCIPEKNRQIRIRIVLLHPTLPKTTQRRSGKGGREAAGLSLASPRKHLQ